MEQEDHHDNAEGRAHEAVQHDVDRPGQIEKPDHQKRVQHAPEIVEALEVPQSRTAGRTQPNLLGQVGDLPVMPDVAVPADPRILGIGQDEHI